MADFSDARDLPLPHRSRAASRENAASEHAQGSQLAAAVGNAGVARVLDAARVQCAGATAAQTLDESIARAIEQQRGRGDPLDEATRLHMEGALGHDLSDVRVHTDRTAHELNEAVSARAFTTGNDVFFTQGTYDPGSSSGKELLGHELTHVAQQREGTSGLAAGEVSHPSDPAEQQAAAAGTAIASGGARPVAAAGTAGHGVAREPQDELDEEGVAAARDADTSVAREADDDLEEGVAGAWESRVARQEEDDEELPI